MFKEPNGFLPVCRRDAEALGWDRPDFVYVTGDAYVDHPSFGVAIISRVLEDAGFRVAILPQPDWKNADAMKEYGRPRLGFLVTGGNIDSMVAHYTAAKRLRNYDYYSPGGEMGHRPDRAVIVYCNRIREAYGDVPIILGGLEASLRRLAHYDYWDNRVRRSILVDSRADLLTYGMGENILRRVAELLDRGVPIKKIRDVRGTVYLSDRDDPVHFPVAGEFDYDLLKTDREEYARAFGVQYKQNDAINGRAVVEFYDSKKIVQNPPMPPLEREELDEVYALPYMRTYHPMYEEKGGVPAITEVRFSITHNRGCFGGCNFCALAFHQGRTVRSRSMDSVLEEAKLLTSLPDFKGYINDIGGPTANFRYPACKKQLEHGVCPDRRCLVPKPCKNLIADNSEYTELLEKAAALPKVKKVFVRSGVRFDYVMAEDNDRFLRCLIKNHVSGQLKVAPEHCSAHVLSAMGKPDYSVYSAFRKKFFDITKEVGLEQYMVPYLMSSHPGSTLEDALALALELKRSGYSPEQVQDFYPTPGTASTVMFYTGIDPFSGKKIYVADYEEKLLQRALLQYGRPENADKVRKALKILGREDLIGFSADCLVKPYRGGSGYKGAKPYTKNGKPAEKPKNPKSQAQRKPTKPAKKDGWAKAKPKAGTKAANKKRSKTK